VIIPTHGRQSLLAAALESVRAQTYSDFECIVVDDASPEPVALPFDDDERFQIVRRLENGGPAAARNTGLQHATGEIVAFLDDDDLFRPNRLEDALALLREADISFCGGGRINEPIQPSHLNLNGDVHGSVLDRTAPHLGTVAVLRSKCPPFDERFPAAEDLDWLLRTTNGLTAASTPSVGWLWRRHDAIRGSHGVEARINGSRLLLALHQEYFRQHRAARAFRYHRIALMSLQVGDRRGAMSAATRALLGGQVRSVRPLMKAALRR
jgi:glycosyltransferase involved in cell wall biosynthesis